MTGPHPGQQRRALHQLVAGQRDRGARPGSRRAGGWPVRRVGGRWRWPSGSRSGTPAPPGPRRCPARARPWPRGPGGRRPAAAVPRSAGGPPTGCRDGRPPAGRRRRGRPASRPRPGRPTPRRATSGSSGPRRRASWWATRSAILRVLTKISVVRWVEDVVGDAVEDVGELAAAGHRLQFAVGQLDGHVEVPSVAAVHDGRGPAGRIHPRQQAGDHLEGALGGRETDPLQPSPPGGDQMVEPLEGEGQMGSPLVPGQGVDLVDDHGVDTAQHRPGRRGRQQQVERLGRGDQQVGGRTAHGGALRSRRVTRPDGHREVGGGAAPACRLPGDTGQRHLQVLVDVGGQGPQGRDVDHARAGGRAGGHRAPSGRPIGGVDGHQEPREGLARAGGGGHQHVPALGDAGPGCPLGLRRAAGEAAQEPSGHGRVERPQDGVGGQRIEVGRWRPAPRTGRRPRNPGRDEVERQGLGIGPAGPAPDPTGRQGGGHVSMQA